METNRLRICQQFSVAAGIRLSSAPAWVASSERFVTKTEYGYHPRSLPGAGFETIPALVECDRSAIKAGRKL